MGRALAVGNDHSVAIVAATNNVGGRNLDREVCVDDIGQGGDVRVHRITFKLLETMNVDVKAGDFDVNVIGEDILEATKV